MALWLNIIINKWITFFEVHFSPLATICHGKIRLTAWHTASASAISAPQQEKVLFSLVTIPRWWIKHPNPKN